MRYQGFDHKLLKILSTVSLVEKVLIFIFGYLLISANKAVAIPKSPSAKFIAQTPTLPKNIPETIVISRFKIVGNNVIPQTEIDRALKPYLFRPLHFTELLEIQQVITQLYIDRGYFTTGAFIPPQKISDRTVEVKIIEGTIGEIEVLGLKKLHPEYIRSRVAIASEAPVNQDKLLEALQLLQLNPLIKKISAELSQGIKPGESFLKLEIEEADSFDLTLNIDNDITASVGSLRSRVSIDNRNLSGLGDTFRVSYAKSEGSESLERLQYIAPLGARGTSVRISHNRSENQIILEPFTSLNLGSDSLGYGVTIIQDVINKPSQNLIAAFAFTHQNTQFSINDRGFFDLARGLDEDGRSIISTLRFIQEYSDRSSDRVFSIASQVAIGIDAFGSTINNNESPDSKYLLWQGQSRYLRAISGKTNLNLRGTIQLANRPLFAQEQFLAGGVTSVRGYSRDIIQGDNGVSFSVGLNHTVLNVPEWDLRVEVSPFFDFARIWNTDDFRLETNTLASVGIAAQLSLKDNISALIGIGIPLIDAKLPEGNSLQDQGIHFSFSVKPF